MCDTVTHAPPIYYTPTYAPPTYILISHAVFSGSFACSKIQAMSSKVCQQSTPKKARTARPPVPFTSSHPTMTWVSEILATLDSELKALKGQPAHDFGGISAFSTSEYEKAMTENGEYDCNVTLAQHAIMRLEHPDIWPVVGAIKRLKANVFTSDTGEPLAVFPHAIFVRAVSAIDAPEQCERLHRSAYLFAFLASWVEAKNAGKKDIADAFLKVAHRVRTKFLLLQCDDAADRMKWNLAEEIDSMADNGASLVGYKKTFGVVVVQTNLQNRGLAHDATAVFAWFSKVRWSSESDTLSIKEVNRHIRVHSRLSANAIITQRLDLAESRFGRRHALAFLSTLELICAKTTVPNNFELSRSLLLWAVEGTVVLMLRGCIKSDIGRRVLGTKIVPKLLLVRRITLFLLNRFKYTSAPGTIYLEGYEPENVGKTLFGSFAAFHRAYPAGDSMEQCSEDKTRVFAEPSSFLTKLTETHVTVLEFLARLLSCSGDIDNIVSSAVGQDATMSAETFFQRRNDLATCCLFDLSDVTEKHRQETKIPEPVARQIADHDEAASTSEPEHEPPEPQPDPKNRISEDSKNSRLYFSKLAFSEAARARLDSVEPKMFAEIFLMQSSASCSG